MEKLANIEADRAAALLDTDSLIVNFEWDKTRFPLNAQAARLVIQAMNILQVYIWPIVSLTNVSY